MNHRQKNEYIAELEQSLNAVNESTLDILRYLNSPKFHCGDGLDNYVNTSDIRSRLMIVRDKMFCNSMEFAVI
jgi:hypothetical protein